MTEMDQSRLTTEELRQALELMLMLFARHDRWCGHNKEAPGDMIVNVAPERAYAVLDRLAGDKPPADSIRVYECEECGRPTLFREDRCCSGRVMERVYVPAGDKPDREAMVQQVRAVLDAAPMAGECTCPPDDNSCCDACKNLWADAIVTNLYPSKP